MSEYNHKYFAIIENKYDYNSIIAIKNDSLKIVVNYLVKNFNDDQYFLIEEAGWGICGYHTIYKGYIKNIKLNFGNLMELIEK